MSDETTLYCTFCGNSQHEVKKLIAGPTVFICDECVKLCNTIVVEAEAKVADDNLRAMIREELISVITALPPTEPAKPTGLFARLFAPTRHAGQAA